VTIRAASAGLFAAMPLPDVDASLKELGYALDTLKADGIGLLTSYGDKWPGDPLFRPVFEELDRRKAVVYFHPTTPNCCGNLIPAPAGPATIEWPVDTARAIVSLLKSGSLVRYPNIRFIFSHAGGALPALSGRIANFVARDKDRDQYAPHGAVAEFTRLYYDTANATAAPSMAALMAMAPVSQIVFGSDYPYFSLEENVAGLAKIRLGAADRQAINRGNMARLLPRFAA
jgi:6-methylsalicylate decarboxylase